MKHISKLVSFTLLQAACSSKLLPPEVAKNDRNLVTATASPGASETEKSSAERAAASSATPRCSHLTDFSGDSDKIYFGCALFGSGDAKLTSEIESAQFAPTTDGVAGTLHAALTGAEALPSWPIVLPLSKTELAKYGESELVVQIGGVAYTYQIQLTFASILSILNFSAGELQDFGSGALRQATDVTLSLTHTGDVASKITQVAGGTSAVLGFKGGAFPGVGGTCTTTITASCDVVVSFTPSVLGAVEEIVQISYSNGVTTAKLNLTLRGMGTLQATHAIGQLNLVSGDANAGGVSAATLNTPGGSFSDGTRLFVADKVNHRVLIWSTLPATAATASLVLGQASFTANSANAGGAISSATLNDPQGIYFDGTRLYVADTGNHRVLIWNQLPTQNQQAADVVIGQADFSSGSANRGSVLNATSQSLWGPTSVFVGGGRLFVADSLNNRVLVWTSMPLATDAAATYALGQASLTQRNPNGGGAASSSVLSGPVHAMTDGTRVLVADRNNNRVLIWNAVPTASGVSADLVLGQPNFASVQANAAEDSAEDNTLSSPGAVWSDGTRLTVADQQNHRIVIWQAIPTTSFASADLVFGQLNFQGLSVASPTSTRVRSPSAISMASGDLWISDSGNNRVLRMPLP